MVKFWVSINDSSYAIKSREQSLGKPRPLQAEEPSDQTMKSYGNVE
jgi:hypothetical protein